MQVGDVFAGTYRIDDEVARGGMGVVYRALDLGLDRPVALKVMAASLGHDEVYRARFRREAAMAARIDHPHVVPVFHRGEHDGVLFVVMRLIDGIDLHELLAREPVLDPQRTSRLVTEVAGALDAAHGLGMVHRDVKPANILLQNDTALLTDFGLAREADGGNALTSMDMMLGTAAYLSPEQALGKALDGSCDVYALACVAYQCLSGQTPYPSGPALAVAQAHVYEPVPDLAAVAPTLSPEVVAVISRGLAKESKDRWPTAGAFATALAEAVKKQPTAELPVVLAAAPSRKRWWVAAGLVVVAAAGGIGFALSSPGDSKPSGAAVGPAKEAHAALIARLPSTVFKDCKASPAREMKGIATAVDCLPVSAGVDSLLVSQFSSPAVMLDEFLANYANTYPDGKCSRQTQVRSTWTKGRLVCYANTNAAAVLLYDYKLLGVQVLAIRADGDHAAVYSWWRDHSSTPIAPAD